MSSITKYADEPQTSTQLVFQNSTSYPIGASNFVGTGDLNGDGRTDIVVTFYDSRSVNSILGVETQNTDGTFTLSHIMNLPTNYSSSGPNYLEGITLGDINSDGIPDLIVGVPSPPKTPLSKGSPKSAKFGFLNRRSTVRVGPGPPV